MKFLPDKSIASRDPDVDLLGFGAFAEGLLSALSQTQPPFVYGLLGDWGSGKTSILNILREEMKKNLAEQTAPLIPIWFDAWKYENETNLIYPLLHAIRADHRARIKQEAAVNDFKNKFRDVLVTSTLALTDVSLRAATKHLTGEAFSLQDASKYLEDIRENPESLEQVLGGWADEIGKLEEAFKTLLDAYADDLHRIYPKFSKDDFRFVILIDDLDRCLPENTVSILESIKNFLSVENCIYILAINPRVVYQGIRSKYQHLEVDGREYLEKILNYAFYVPEPSSERITSFAETSLSKLLEEQKESLRKQYQPYIKEFGTVLGDCHVTNPRKIKRILNHYLAFLTRFQSKMKQYSIHNVIRLIFLAEYFPDIFNLFLTENTSKVLKKLNQIGTVSFDFTQFEGQYGVNIQSVYLRLAKMRNLYTKFVEPGDITRYDLKYHAQAVNQIIRQV